MGRSLADLGAPIGSGRTAVIYAWDSGRALKLFRPDWARDAEEEYAATRLAGERAAPAPEVFGIEEVEGRPGIVMERVDGESMLASMGRKPWRARGYARLLAEMQWELHQLPGEGLRDQRATLRHDIDRGLALSEAERASLLDLLDRMPAGDRLCHWDFHPDNIIMTARGPVIIDWITAQAGNPVADFGRSTVLFATATLPASLHGWKRALVGRGRRVHHADVCGPIPGTGAARRARAARLAHGSLRGAAVRGRQPPRARSLAGARAGATGAALSGRRGSDAPPMRRRSLDDAAHRRVCRTRPGVAVLPAGRRRSAHALAGADRALQREGVRLPDRHLLGGRRSRRSGATSMACWSRPWRQAGTATR